MWRLEKEKLIPEYLQQTNTGDGGNLGWYLRFWKNDCRSLHGKYGWPVVLRRFRNRSKAFYGKIFEEN